MDPTISPMIRDANTTLVPTSMEMRAPKMTRERMSRPNSSVPNQCAFDGGCNRAGRLSAAGSCGAIHGANIANSTKTVTITAPAAASGRLRACRAPLANDEPAWANVAIAGDMIRHYLLRSHMRMTASAIGLAVLLVSALSFAQSHAGGKSPTFDAAIEQKMFRLLNEDRVKR